MRSILIGATLAASHTHRAMIVCLCHRISDRDIERAVQGGTRTFDELQDDTCIARNCECCTDCAREVFDAARARAGARLYLIEEPVPA